jgi:transcriptional regulator with XRE-family HTH domain
MKKSKSEIDEYIGSRIRECRLSLHLTQELLARALGVSFRQVQNYEKGANGISAVRLFDFCKILNVSLASMFLSDHSSVYLVLLPDHDRIIGRRLHCPSPKIKPSIDGRLICDPQICGPWP